MGEPNWILVTFIGALAGYLLPHLSKVLVYVARRFQRATIEGKWYVYHITNRGGELQVEPAAWNIRKGYDSKFVVVESFKEDLKGPMYKGQMSFERNFLLVKLRAVKHEEEVSIRLFNPIPTADAYTWGLFLSLDFQGNPIAGPVAISRRELSPADALELLLDKTKVHANMKVLTLANIMPGP
jgi:hypothetical protein